MMQLGIRTPHPGPNGLMMDLASPEHTLFSRRQVQLASVFNEHLVNA